MDTQIVNNILQRTQTIKEIKAILESFDENADNVLFKKGIYIYGGPGCGKTHFIMELLKECQYDTVKYDAGDVRNKTLIDTITSNNISNQNVLDMMARKTKKIAIVMDEIDGMNSGDKGGITALIKIIRQKKTKKQRLENKTANPIICIGNYNVDKKIKELMKVCNVFELKTPTEQQIISILNNSLPNSSVIKDNTRIIIKYIQNDMRKLAFAYNMIKKEQNTTNVPKLLNVFHNKMFNEDPKTITKTLLNNHFPLDQHATIMNETDRTIVALLWHENVVDVLQEYNTAISFPLYSKMLKNMCFSDYIDRITFQHQIWQFNEMSSLMKTFHNNKIYHDYFNNDVSTFNPDEVRFTKVLTKYSTEYNNMLFIYQMSQKLDMDKKDVFALFQEMRLYAGEEFNDANMISKYEQIFDDYEITKLDVRRMYRYLDKTVKKDLNVVDDLDDDA